MENMQKEEIHVELNDGSRNGPYQATVAGETVLIWDEMADLENSKNIVQTLPNGKERRLGIRSYEFYRKMGGGMPANYQVKIGEPSKIATPTSSVTHNYNIGGSSNVQIGDGNKQEIAYFIEHMRNSIAASSASENEKAAAYSLLDQFSAHPVISSIIGSAAWSAIVQASS